MPSKHLRSVGVRIAMEVRVNGEALHEAQSGRGHASDHVALRHMANLGLGCSTRSVSCTREWTDELSDTAADHIREDNGVQSRNVDDAPFSNGLVDCLK